jgi:glycosyltransferase involved in cell wall biosynthesis
MTTALLEHPPAAATLWSHGPVALVMPVATPRGGCETMLLNLLRANRSHGGVDYRVCFTEPGEMVEEVRRLGYPVWVLDVGRLREATKYVRSVLALRAWMKREGIVHALSFMEKSHLYVGVAGKLAGVGTSWWLHSIDPPSRMMKLITAVPARHIFSDSKAAADFQATRRPYRETTVCHCSVDLSRFSAEVLPSPIGARERLGLPTDRPIVGIVARLQRWKGIDVFVEAAAKVLALSAGKPPCFVIVGGEHTLEPGVKAELERQIADLSIGHAVRMVGYQSNVPQWMQACDVIVHASTGIEPFGTVIIEGMALGKNVIAAAAGGPLEIITEGVDGRFAPPGDAEKLADAMRASLADTPQNHSMREAARNRAAYFNADRLSRDVAEKLKDLILHA